MTLTFSKALTGESAGSVKPKSAAVNVYAVSSSVVTVLLVPTDSPVNALLNVKLTTIPGAGTLALSGVAVTAGQFVSVANINAGNLKFTPAANANGAGYASFTFQVQDDGGTANGGGDLDSSARTMTVNVTSVNDAPIGTSKAVTTLEDTAYTFTAADFGFTDPSDTPVNALLNVKITTVPGAGTLALSGVAVTAGQFVPVANINAGNLKFTPAANASGAAYAAFTFQVQDSGGVANGGVDLDAIPRTMTVNVTAVNDAPVGTNKTVTTLEDTAYIFTAADFGFTDSSDAPANALLNVKITTLPGAGTLRDNGVNVTVGQFVSLADINAGNLVFTPAANGNGAGYASFTFRVQDDGGTANGGVDLDTTARTMTVNVTPVNDAPLGTAGTITMIADTAHTFSAGEFGFTDPADAGAAAGANALAAVKITTLPGAGVLTDNAVNVVAGQFVTVAAINAGNLVFTPATHATGAGYGSFTFQVEDDGGVANAGGDIDATARTLTVDVNAGVAVPPPVIVPPPVVVVPPTLPPPIVVAPVVADSTPVAAKSVITMAPPPGAIVVNPRAPDYVLSLDNVLPATPSYAQAFAGTSTAVTGIAHQDAIELQKLALIDGYARAATSDAPPGITIGVAYAGDGTVCGRDSGSSQALCEDPAKASAWVRGGIKATGVVISAGFVAWAMRGAGILTSILSAAPAWRHLDPMPVLAPEEEKPEWGDE